MSEPQEPMNFEQALADLERIVRELEDGKVGLEESLNFYTRGVTLLQHCYGQLRKAEIKIQELIGTDGQGNILTCTSSLAAIL